MMSMSHSIQQFDLVSVSSWNLSTITEESFERVDVSSAEVSVSWLTHQYDVLFVHEDIQSGYNLDSDNSSADYEASDSLGATAMVSGGSSPLILKCIAVLSLL